MRTTGANPKSVEKNSKKSPNPKRHFTRDIFQKTKKYE